MEIINRIGYKNKTFVEFGCGGTELENNTFFLVKSGWKGLWMDADLNKIKYLNKIFKISVNSKRLQIKHEIINSKNINDLFIKYNFNNEIDILSIDIDSNDYWIWKNIDLNIINPRIVILEYNAKYKPPMEWIRENSEAPFSKNDWMGASLESLTKLSNKKGYTLVGCSIGGTNSYFIRDDLLNENFSGPFTAENHFNQARYYLCRNFNSKNISYSGMKNSFGPFLGEDEKKYD